MIKIRYISDLHIDECPIPDKIINNSKNIGADICIIAGDICSPFDNKYERIIDKMSKIHAKVFIVSGNHEYYNDNNFKKRDTSLDVGANATISRSHFREFEETDNKIGDIAGKFINVHFLQKTSIIYKNIRFMGCTLWSEIKNKEYGKTINDIKYIQNYSVDKYNKLHKDHSEWIIGEQYKNSGLYNTTILVTHHLPSTKLINQKYEGSISNEIFASDVFDKFENIDYIIYGHTHIKQDHLLICKKNGNAVSCHCNPRGHEYEESGWNINNCIEIKIEK